MFIKITKKNIDRLGEGAIVVRFPLIGDAITRIDISDPKNFQAFQIDRVWRTSLDLVAAPDNPRTEFAHDAKPGHAINKKQSEMTNEDKWWLYEDMLYIEDRPL